MKSIYWLKTIVITLLLTSCMSNQDNIDKTILVASKRLNCTGVGTQKCLLVKETTGKNWEYFYDNIEGFNYEEGFEYVLEVSEKEVSPLPADASTVKIVLVKIVSKIKKDSENLPKN
ncbi:DUF4377 domain-containing protein [Tenacibaculum aiptasiae]|uniref:DUF4377 domain-containing protein n=1 Tax=Tenacibaculum aiptasiae TaxID=426481 RepID=A0A7J5AS04_9FLAO|nr:DUF4377 domain-containing protein [Tenacibaculum aiptasiae]KAB1160402.1 DUF4377 domain-containing protein [Tenacibaculum aiptasiae]